MTTAIPGAPVHAPAGTTMRIMFLGGPLDHTIREVAAVRGVTLTPLSEHYYCPVMPKRTWNYQAKAYDPVSMEQLVYDRHRITTSIGDRSWFVYILAGYSPPRSHLLDANPYPI